MWINEARGTTSRWNWGFAIDRPIYLHNGACETLLCVVSDKNHRTGNGKLPDVIGHDQNLQEMLATFLESIDDLTLPFPP